MCTKELAALATVLVLALGTAVSMISLSGFALWFQPREVPAKSALANFTWTAKNRNMKITDAQKTQYQNNGFMVFRDVIDPKAIDLLLEEAQRLCKFQFWVSRVCQIEEGRWQSDLIRDFLFYSNVSDLAAQLVWDKRMPPMRVYQDGIVGITKSWLQPLFYTFTKHVDHGGVPGVWHGLHSDTRGVGLWIPLVEVDPNTTGGSIELYSGFPKDGCQMIWGEKSTVDGFDATINMSKIEERCNKHKADNHTVKPKLKPGDVVAWWPSMMHKTQPVLEKGFVRYALYIRLVSNETMLCMQKDCGWKGRPCCSAQLPKSGMTIKTPCYPQVWPHPLADEVKSHFSKRPQPLVDRSKIVSKYSSDIWGTMHAVCKKHRQGGPSHFWDPLKYEAPLPAAARPPVIPATEFDCYNAKHEGSCWVLYQEGIDWESVPWFALNETQYGMPFWFSKDITDLENMYRVEWNATVRGVKEEDGWIRVGDYYIREELFGARYHPADFLMATSGSATGGAPSSSSVGSKASDGGRATPKAQEPAESLPSEPAESAHTEL